MIQSSQKCYETAAVMVFFFLCYFIHPHHHIRRETLYLLLHYIYLTASGKTSDDECWIIQTNIWLTSKSQHKNTCKYECITQMHCPMRVNILIADDGICDIEILQHQIKHDTNLTEVQRNSILCSTDCWFYPERLSLRSGFVCSCLVSFKDFIPGMLL